MHIYRDALFKLHTQSRGSIALLECNGNSLEKEREGLVVMCNGLLMPANIREQTGPMQSQLEEEKKARHGQQSHAGGFSSCGYSSGFTRCIRYV